jgi:hypothetical protein
MPKGEKILAQSKRTAPPPIFKIKFSIGILLISFKIGIPLEIMSQLVSIFQINIYLKTLLNTKRRISSRGVLFKSKKKHLKQGEKFQILKMLLAILFIYL